MLIRASEYFFKKTNMILSNKLLKKYNTPESLIVIASYPKKGEKYSQGVCATASFTKNTLESLKATQKGRPIIVLSIALKGWEEIYEENGMLIVRCFFRNKILSYQKAISYINRFNEVSNVLIEFEFSSFGDTIATSALSILIWILFFLGKRVTLVVHQVLLDLGELSGHIGIAPNRPLSKLLNLFLLIYYRIISFPVINIVVLEDKLKDRLSKFVNVKKIYVVPHGVDTTVDKKITKTFARNKLKLDKDELIILSFGYVTWYKGTDFLVKALKKIRKINGKKLHLVIAGGESFTQQHKKHYQNFYRKVVREVKQVSRITLTGFINEKDIPLYFKACDLVVFPYRTFMSSSGPLATALAYGKPFIISSALKEILLSDDVQKSLIQAGLQSSDLTFNLIPERLQATLEKMTKARQMKKLTKLSQILKQKRSFKKLAPMYVQLLSCIKPSLIISPSLKNLRLGLDYRTS